ncbi:discoidin domain-containing protein [Streptomyces olivaceus]|uniref:discoidin domain-containing protein n=1 Tax=Streptomyces olivaceus TaxID=47716 RepID=UPI001CCF52F3|nr:discoidin domain-containing protein [Streptomyces olivaceus]MBZ6295623.1 discoidin domain-containing protein [Streptomyces olivaceus]MBZ6327620.1 discoidin domain-containing protein [Streptomyces olivaceus]
MRIRNWRSRALCTVVTTSLLALGGPLLSATAAGGPNIAVGDAARASSAHSEYGAANITDGNQGSYWESGGGGLPQWVQADLGATERIDEVVLKLPAGWESRRQTLSLQGSADGTSFSTLKSSATYAFDPGSGNTVTVSLPATLTRYVRVDVTANTGRPAAQLSELEVHAAGDASADLAAGRRLTASSSTGTYIPANGNDGNRATYWESDDKALPQWIQADLGSSRRVDRVVLRLPDGWPPRSQTLKIQGSENGSDFTDLTAAEAHTFDAAGGQVATVAFDAATTRHVRVLVSANTGQAAAQISELEVYGPATGDTQAPTTPANLAFTEPATGQIRLTWDESEDDTAVTGYDVYAGNKLRGSVAGDVTTYTDKQPASANVTYYVRARDAAGNESAASNSVIRNGTKDGSNLAVGKPISASSVIHTYVAENANDNSTSTYWEGAAGSYPNTLTVKLGADADISEVVLKLNPDPSWSKRTQRIEVLGRAQDAEEFTGLVAAKDYVFDPASGGNGVTVPVGDRVADVRLRFTSNTGATAGQIAEFQVVGVPAPNPDLEVTGLATSPASPVESDEITVSATVRNSGAADAPAGKVALRLGGTKVADAGVPALKAGAESTVSASVGVRDAGSYELSAVADEADEIIEENETNNTYTRPEPLVVKPVQSSDLVAAAVTTSPSSPSAGDDVTFGVALRNQGTQDSAGGSHGVTLALVDAEGDTVRTLTGAHSGVIAAGGTSPAIGLGTWKAANGSYSLKVTVADDANELPVKRENNTSTQALFVGRGADMPYDMYEAEDGTVGGGAKVVGPNRTIGDIAGEASGRRAVQLDGTGEYVEFTTRADTNTLVTRFSIPDAPGGGGIDATLDVYVDGVLKKALPLTSKYAWLYGNEASPGNSPGAGAPRHIYDEAHLMLGETVPAGSTIRLQKDAANSTDYAIDFVNLEQVAEVPNPDPAAYAVPDGFTHQDVQNALDRVRMDTSGKLVGVYLPAGDYQTSSKFQVYGKAVKVVGAGPWFTTFRAPTAQDNTDVGFRAEASAKGSSFANFTYFGNYTSRIDGPGKVFDFSNVSDIVIDNIWNEHMVCLYWGANTDRVTIRNSRIRNMFADGVNMTNGSTDNLVSNNDARATGDDSFALFSAIDAGGADMKNNVYENLSTTLTWRAAGLAVYGGYNNTFRNIHIADTLVYSGITISSLDFGYPMNGFGTDPTTFENVSIVRAGGHFWGGQTFPGIWVFSASKVFQGIRVSNVDIVDPTYSGIMFQTNYVGGQPQYPIKDTVFTDVSVTGARKSGDEFDAKSGFGLWANELPEAGQGPAVGEVTFNGLRLEDNAVDVRNTTSTFEIVRNP